MSALSLGPILQAHLPDAAYPTSPIAQFPPLPSSIRRPIRMRDRRIPLTIVTSFSHNPLHDSNLWPQKGHIQPHRSHLPRRRKANRHISHHDEDSEPATEPKLAEEKLVSVSAEVAAAQVVPPAEAKQDQLLPSVRLQDRAVQELVPGLFIGFSSPSTDLSLDDDAYTHVVQIVHQSTVANRAQGNWDATEQSFDGRVQRLRLTLRDTSQDLTQRVGLSLSDAQLRASRDFLAQALPYSSVSQSDATGVRVMITTPFGRPTDAMCVASCYLAFISGKRVGDVLRFVDEEEDFLSVWKGEVSEDEVERTEKVARLWSWLSTVVRK